MMRVINIVPDVQPVRMGVWLPGANVSTPLLQNHGMQTEIWFPGDDYKQNFFSAVPVQLKNTSTAYLDELIIERKLDPKQDIIVTNSQWSYQHKWGYHLAKRGFKWICMPHGTLQKWAMNQGGWKKKPYFHLILKPMLKKAALIRASGVLEMEDMRNIMPEFKIIQIPNGVEIQDKYDGAKEDNGVKIFLFMARINFKKRILPLTQAWLESPLNNNPVFRFIIAGPDDGDLEKLLPLVKQSNNIEYVGPIYGEQKEAWLRKSIFYVMPSLLEGFATSVLEAASRASIPVITPECNFPEIVEAGYAIETGTEKEKIKESLIRCSKMTDMEINKMAKGARQFISENYSIDIITNRLYTLYANLLNT